MMALQQSLLSQTDLVPVLLDFDFQLNKDDQLFVRNPPTVDLSKSVEADFSGFELDEQDVA